MSLLGESHGPPSRDRCDHFPGFGGFTLGMGSVFCTGGKPLSFVCTGRLGGCRGVPGFLSVIVELRVVAYEIFLHLLFSFAHQLWLVR